MQELRHLKEVFQTAQDTIKELQSDIERKDKEIEQLENGHFDKLAEIDKFKFEMRSLNE